MIPYVRRKKLLELIVKKELVYIEELISTLSDISGSTIRRDLKTLENEGHIEMLRGGGVKLKVSPSADLPLDAKLVLNNDKKQRIAQYAASIVNDGEVIYVDISTTVLPMIKFLKNKRITVVASNAQFLNELEGTDITCIVLGGEYIKNTGSFVGPINENLLSTMFFDKAFVGANGFSLQGGISTPDFREVKKKQIIMQNSKEAYMLMDSSKAGVTTLCKVFELGECNIITDEYNEILESFKSYIVAP